MRECFLAGVSTSLSALPPALEELLQPAAEKFQSAIICEFGFAEEAICLVHFTTQKSLVLIGECLRPTMFEFVGSPEEASATFLKLVAQHRK
jgi:hypothetical protein